MEVRKCQACAAPMIFISAIRKKDGKETTFPLDAQPSTEGSWFISENEESETTGKPMARYVGKYDADYRKLSGAKLLHTPHHATCPQADQFRGKKGQ